MAKELLKGMKTNILITGGAGFVGSNLAIFLKQNLKNCRIICFDNLVRLGSELNVKRLNDQNINFVKGDVRRKNQLLALRDIDLILDCAAEPSVLASYENPEYTIETNLIGTVHCLELAKRDNSNIIFLSSNRVYAVDPVNQIPFEEFPTRFDWKKNIRGQGYSYEGISSEFSFSGVRSLYGASKLCSEHICLEYFESFGLKGVINRLGLIAGPWQMGRIDQGLVGFWVAQHKFKNKLSYIGYGGYGKQVRDVIHVDDVCELILYQIENMNKLSGRTYNVGGGRKNSISLLELSRMVEDITGTKALIERVAETRKADLRIYITDNAQVTKDTGWKPEQSVENIIADTANWIDQHFDLLNDIFLIDAQASHIA